MRGGRTRNAETGAKSRPHHCTECNSKSEESCIHKGHIAYCTAMVDHEAGLKCGEKYHVISRGGCAKHPYRDGHNWEKYAERKGYSPKDFDSTPYPIEEAQPEEEAATQEEELPFDTDWHKTRREKSSPEKKEKQKKGQHKTPDMKEFLQSRRATKK